MQQASKPGLLESQKEHSICLPWSGTLSSCHGNPESRPRCLQRVPSRYCEQFSPSGPNAPPVQSRCDWCWSPVPPEDVVAHLSRYCSTTRTWSKVQCCNTNTRQNNESKQTTGRPMQNVLLSTCIDCRPLGSRAEQGRGVVWGTHSLGPGWFHTGTSAGRGWVLGGSCGG